MPAAYDKAVRRLQMDGKLTSRKLAAVLGGILGLLGLAAFQVFGDVPLAEQQFNLLAVGITTLAGGGAVVQGIIDGMKVGK